MEIRYAQAPRDVKRYDQAELREAFLVEDVFPENDVRLVYSHVDRLILGGCRPVDRSVVLSDGKDIGTEYLLSHREMGVINVGGPGRVVVDGTVFHLENRDALYIGRGARVIEMSADDPGRPPRFYLNSTAAGVTHPTRLIRLAEAKPVTMGDAARGNLRTLRMYIHPEVAPSCLLMMGVTRPEPGSVWNTMPCHVHERRMEAYLYFDLAEDDRVVHLMGEPGETKHMFVADGQAVISPSWSIHMGAGTGPYSFIWGMTGENQEYTDVAPVPASALR